MRLQIFVVTVVMVFIRASMLILSVIPSTIVDFQLLIPHAMLAEISRFSSKIGEDFCSDFCITRELSVLWLSMVSVDNLKSKGRSKAPIGVTAKLT